MEEIFLECSSYFSWVHLKSLYIVVKFQTSTSNTFQDMNYCLVIFGPVQTDGQTESDAYEPTVQSAQVVSIMNWPLMIKMNTRWR